MKRIPNYLIVAVCMITVYLMACRSQKMSLNKNSAPPDVVDIMDFSSQLDKNLNPIPFNEARTLHQHYKKRFKDRLEKNMISFDNTVPQMHMQSKSIWFSYEQFKAFTNTLDNIKRAMEKDTVKYKNRRLSGVRIYFSAYPKDYKEIEFRRKLTLILCGTYLKKSDAITRNYDLETLSTDGIKQLISLSGYYNHGHLCPPQSCDSASLDKE